MTDVVDYESFRFNTLARIEDAAKAFNSLDASPMLSDVIGPMIVANKMDRIVALTLLHSHFPVPINGKLVHYGNVATAWSPTNLESCERSIQPLNWQFVEAGSAITPYEFKYSQKQEAEKKQLTPKVKEFLQILGSLLIERGLANLFGVQLLSGTHNEERAGVPGVEITAGNASIILPGEVFFQHEQAPEKAFVETKWEFEGARDAQDGTPVVRKKRKNVCEVYSGKHTRLHENF